MLALGLCNIASSFVQAMPVSGALSRGAVNHSSGVKTTFGGVYTGIIVLLSLHFFTPYFSYIPKAALAAVIIAAVVFMVELHVVKPMWKTKSNSFLCSNVKNTVLSLLAIILSILRPDKSLKATKLVFCQLSTILTLFRVDKSQISLFLL